MKPHLRTALACLALLLILAGIAGCALHLLGAAFFEQSACYFVPPVSALLLLCSLAIPRRRPALTAAWLLASGFILSYAANNWAIAVERFGPESLYYFPDLAEAVLVLVLLAAIHRRHRPSPSRD